MDSRPRMLGMKISTIIRLTAASSSAFSPDAAPLAMTTLWPAVSSNTLIAEHTIQSSSTTRMRDIDVPLQFERSPGSVEASCIANHFAETGTTAISRLPQTVHGTRHATKLGAHGPEMVVSARKGAYEAVYDKSACNTGGCASQCRYHINSIVDREYR